MIAAEPILKFIDKEIDNLRTELRSAEEWDDHDIKLAIKNQITALMMVRREIEYERQRESSKPL